jgi:uncharacterized protein with FMN-binding domain
LVLLFSIGGYIVYQNWTGLLQLISGGSPSNLSPSDTSNLTPPFKDGIYTGNQSDAVYGNIQVKTTIQNSKIADIQFLQYPNDRSRSVEINTAAMPSLKQEAIQIQSAQVDIISGATLTSEAFTKSLQSALAQAK